MCAEKSANEPYFKDNGLESFNHHKHLIFDAETTLTIEELFQMLERTFDDYHNREKLRCILPLIHKNIHLFLIRDYDKYDIGNVLYEFYKMHKEDEEDIMIVVQIVYQVLNSIHMYKENKDNIKVSGKVFIELAKRLLSASDRQLVSNIIACIQLYANTNTENNNLFHQIWSSLKANSISGKTHIDIFIQLFDEFSQIQADLCSDMAVITTIQSLLKSSQRDDRKCGYYLFKKILQSFMISSKKANSQQIEKSWLTYITILENLEENQSHLILPSLKNLQDLIVGKQMESSWMDILFSRIINHKNNLALRWSLEFFLTTFTSNDLHMNVLKELLEACNSNILYNCEGYFLDKKYFLSFLKGDLSHLYVLLGDINWKSVPLHNLLSILENNDLPPSITYDQVLKIVSRVRALQDCHIRQASVIIVNRLFRDIVEKMTLMEYIMYVETLYNTSDRHNIYEQFYKKIPGHIENLQQANGNIFKGRFYEILVANIEDTSPMELADALKKIPLSKHGWLKFLPFHFDLKSGNDLQFTALYGINLNDCISSSLKQIFEYFDFHLSCNPDDKNEIEQRRISAIAFYIHQLQTLDHVDENTLKVLFNYKLTEKMIEKLCMCLETTNKCLDKWIIENLIDLVASVRNENEGCYSLCSYLERNELCNEYISNMLEKCPRFVTKCKSNILKHLNSTDFYCSNVKKGESRIEESYRVKHIGQIDTSLRKIWLLQISLHSDVHYLFSLIKRHKDISRKKTRYFANSYEHRIKMRIALGIAACISSGRVHISHEIFDELWDILLKENNQLNVNYIYEYIIGIRDMRKEVFLKKLQECHSLTSSQQVSILSAFYTFCMSQHDLLTSDDRGLIVMNLMALTMGANFHTRLFAQMVLQNLLETDEFNGLPCGRQIMQSISIATQGKLEEQLDDMRLLLYKFAHATTAWSVILYVTHAPYDEIIDPSNSHKHPTELQKRIDNLRLSFLKKIENTPEDVLEQNSIDQVQRKMNPITDVLETNNLIVYPEKENHNQMFVIASLIDKLPNLGGIARTCEVLGIKNLVMDSKKDIEKNDFKNLSMTAEKTLNIIEVKPRDLRDFIMDKQKEGFALVGAEQTSNSENFVNFKFPEKCILLLGHEKDGIPPNLLGLLDHAVEIPQFGHVRSLNVHVTGALFMWEFCKQRLV
ncbi:uncharacterized protein LOC142222166 [Haematobia irritans]|uniref:uncharacterized protein LOC142222166 n=1 Tax=Haematobia irritans TaxID=7368 RepID=UPI003F50254D